MVIRLVLGTFVLIGVVTGAMPADAADRSFSVTGFDRIRVEGPYKVRLTTGVAPFAKASGSPQGLDAVAVDVQGRTLVVRPNRSSWGGYPGQAVGPVEISVGTHELSAAWLNGSGTLAINQVKGLSFELAVQGAGSSAIGNARVDQLKIGISGAGSAVIGGTAGKLTAIVRGTSSFDASGLRVKDAVLGAEGPSVVKANVTNSAKIDALGASLVEIAGGPACTTKAQGSAIVTGCK